jgi:hypothetical protein
MVDRAVLISTELHDIPPCVCSHPRSVAGAQSLRIPNSLKKEQLCVGLWRPYSNKLSWGLRRACRLQKSRQLRCGFVLGNRFQLFERAGEGVRWLSCAGLSWVLVEDRLEGRDEQASVRV